MITLGSERWTTGNPKITLTFAYEKQRSGADMQYRAKVTISTVSGDSYFGYPIYMKLSIGGSVRETVTLKAADPSRWTTEISYTSPWYTVANKTSGTVPISYNVYSGSGSSRSGTYSYEMGVDAAASEIEVSNGTLGTALTLNLTRYNTNFTDTISYKCGTAGDTIVSGSTAPRVTWDSTKGNTVALSSQNTKGMSVDVTFTVTTYSGSTVVGTNSKTIKMAIPTTVVPSVALKVEDAAGYFATYGAYVQGYSKLKITAETTPAYGSPIQTYAITADGATYNTSPVTTPAVQGKGTLRITAKVTDARKQPNTATPVDITVLEYAKPSVNLSVYRCKGDGTADAEGGYIKIVLSSKIASLNGKNTASYTITYIDDAGTTKTITGTGTSYTSPTPILCGAANTKKVSVTVSDNLGSTPQSVTAPVAYTLVDYRSNGKGIAFGKVGTRDGFDCAMPAYFTGTTELPSDVKVGGSAVVDFVVEEGTSGIWTYRKWASGTAECWGTSPEVTVASSQWSAWGGMYAAANVIQSCYYPVTYTAPPMLQITYRATVMGGFHYVQDTGLASRTPAVSIIRGTAADGLKGCVHFYAIGKCK